MNIKGACAPLEEEILDLRVVKFKKQTAKRITIEGKRQEFSKFY